MVTQDDSSESWVLLSYRIPREPSTPRIAVWRRLKEVGALQIGDGLVALPANPRTREHLEWVAAKVIEADGDAMVWSAAPFRSAERRALSTRCRDERDLEYQSLIDEAVGDSPPDSRTIARWRREWRRIDKRDYFRSPLRDRSRQAIADAAEREVATR